VRQRVVHVLVSSVTGTRNPQVTEQLSRTCRYCLAAPGDWCVTASGRVTYYCHAERFADWQAARMQAARMDVSELAASIVAEAVTEEPAPARNPAAVALGRLGGLKGGPARAAKLTADQRSEIATKAARTRWER
jgi:hypothetical protein